MLLSRTLTTFTLMFSLALGVVCVRLLNPTQLDVSFDSNYLSLIERVEMATPAVTEIEAPAMEFREIRIPAPKKLVARTNRINRPIIGAVAKVNFPEVKLVQVAHSELPFSEPVQLEKIEFKGDLLQNLVALYQDFSHEEKVMVAEVQARDEVKTVQSAADVTPTSEAEPEFFEYKDDEVQKTQDTEVTATQAVRKETILQVAVSEAVSKQEESQNAETSFITFDYSTMKQDIQTAKIPKVSKVASHPKRTPETPASLSSHEQDEKAESSSKMNALLAPSYSSQMTIQAVGTDLKQNEELRGFEVRFQDNYSETHEDYGDGEVTITLKLAQPKMTRSMVLLKRGFVPTNTDLILEDGAGMISVPTLPQDLADELLASSDRKGPAGLLLVELDNETDKATLDVPFEKVLTLDGDLKVTEKDNFRYQLFVGVNAGNALLTYVQGSETTNKITHVHERELTYESNLYEKENLSRIALYQEDLLSREKSPLVTASANVRVFAKDIHGHKLNQNTYKINLGKALLGGRNYIELTHEREPIFVGTKNVSELVIPSEGLIRHILSAASEKSLGKRCVIQVNLGREISEVSVASESTGESLMVTSQYLDQDGHFYDSASEKTRKIIVFGEGQASGQSELSGKVNLKIEYLDGTHDFLGSYCSPNTYLVEQL